jgi:hypothetical protein
MEMQNSPLAFKMSMEGKLRKESSGFALGSALDDLVTGSMTPEQWEAAYPVAKSCEATLASGDRKGQPCGCETKNRYGDQWLCGKHGKGEPTQTAKLTTSDIVACHGMLTALKAADTRLLLDGMKASQLTVLWNDEETGLPCKARLDGVSVCQLPGMEGPGSIRWDLKTTAENTVHGWERASNGYGYWLQDAHYTAGAAAIAKSQSKEPIEIPFMFAVAQSQPENTGEHVAFVWEYDQATREKARTERSYLMHMVKHHIEQDYWPGKTVKGITTGFCPDYIFSHLKVPHE